MPSGGGDREYPIFLGRGRLGALAPVLQQYAPAHRYAVIADSTVAEIYGDRVRSVLEASGLTAKLFTFPAGERHKTRETWADLTDRLLEAGLGRDSAVVALGGGVTGDLAGFVAATYMRGVPVVQVPTTIVAMVDASVGGKTGIDVSAGKNLVGSFHPPAAVVVDPEVIATLSQTGRVEGWVEGVKHGAVLDSDYFESLGREAEGLARGDVAVTEWAVQRSIEIKAGVVTEDELEGGLRQVLNFGHTFGHAIEAASGYGISHGRAVALGMVMAAELGEAAGITEPGTADRLAKALAAFDISVSLPDEVGAGAILPFLSSDKKARAGAPRFVLLEGIGRVFAEGGWSRSLPGELVRGVLESTRLRG